MKVYFANIAQYADKRYSHPHSIIPEMDIACSASLLEREGHTVYFNDFPKCQKNFEDIWEDIAGVKADLVFLKTTTSTLDMAIEFISMKKKDIWIVCIGQHATTMPKTLLEEGADIVLRGEPELGILEVVDFIKKNKDVKGILDSTSCKCLDTLPFPKQEWISEDYISLYPTKAVLPKWGFMLASRGCPKRCLFCSPTLRVSYGKEYRIRSPENVFDEMSFLVKRLGVNSIYFRDDSFGLLRGWLYRLCELVNKSKLKVNWVVQMRADSVESNLLKKMSLAGCSAVCLGVESGSDRILKVLRKDETKETIKKAARAIKASGLKLVAFFMLGSPTETESDVEMTYNLMREIKPDFIQVAFFTPYPGSPAFEELGLKDEFKESEGKFFHYDMIVKNKSQISDERLRSLQKKFYRSFYLNPRFILSYCRTRIPMALKNPRTLFLEIKNSLSFLLVEN